MALLHTSTSSCGYQNQASHRAVPDSSFPLYKSTVLGSWAGDSSFPLNSTPLEPRSLFSLHRLTVWHEADIFNKFYQKKPTTKQEQKQGSPPAINWLIRSMDKNSRNLERYLIETCCFPFHWLTLPNDLQRWTVDIPQINHLRIFHNVSLTRKSRLWSMPSHSSTEQMRQTHTTKMLSSRITLYILLFCHTEFSSPDWAGPVHGHTGCSKIASASGWLQG